MCVRIWNILAADMKREGMLKCLGIWVRRKEIKKCIK